MKIFITGGNGFIGSRVVRLLAERGDSLRLLLRATSRCERLQGLSYDRHEGDVRDPAAVRAGMAGCDAVIHLAAIVSWDLINSPEMTRTLVEGTRNVLEAAESARPSRVVHVSSTIALSGSPYPRVYDEQLRCEAEDAQLTYQTGKREAERLCLAAHGRGLPVVIVNPAEVYGPHDTGMVTAGNLVDFARGMPVLVCSGGTAIAHVDDVAAGVVAALDKGTPGERYILGGENLTLTELARLTLDLVGRKAPVIRVPNPVLRTVARMGQKLKLKLPFNPAVVPYATKYWYTRSDKARDELGVEFRPPREVLAPTIAWLKSSGRI